MHVRLEYGSSSTAWTYVDVVQLNDFAGWSLTGSCAMLATVLVLVDADAVALRVGLSVTQCSCWPIGELSSTNAASSCASLSGDLVAIGSSVIAAGGSSYVVVNTEKVPNDEG